MHLRRPLLQTLRPLMTTQHSRLFSKNVPNKLIATLNNKHLFGDDMVLYGNMKTPGIARLTEDKVNLDTLDHNGNTPLMLAASRGYANVCEHLLQKGANHNLKNDAGQNALHLAVLNGHADVVFRLTGHGVDIKEKFDNKTPLQLATGPNRLVIYHHLENLYRIQEKFTRMAKR